MFRMYYDPTMLLIIPVLILSIFAQFKVKSSYSKYKELYMRNGYTGFEVARMILDKEGLYDVPIEVINKELGDHYDPTKRVLRLSPDVYSGRSISAAGIAAHEVGHAIQHKEHYTPLELRKAMVPISNFGSSLSIVMFILGLILGYKPLVNVGIILFSLAVLFTVVTLPVEFNASKRALKVLENSNILYEDEVIGAKKVLGAAALTYVAAALTAILQLLRLILISRSRD